VTIAGPGRGKDGRRKIDRAAMKKCTQSLFLLNKLLTQEIFFFRNKLQSVSHATQFQLRTKFSTERFINGQFREEAKQFSRN